MISVPRGRRLVEILVIAVAVIAGVSLALARPSFSFGSSESEVKTSVSAARKHALLLVNLSAANGTDSLKKLSENATGAWAEQLKADPGSLVNALKKSNAQTVGRIDSVAVSDETSEKTTIMVAASALVSNAAAGSKQVTRSYYFVMTLVRDGEKWLVSSVETAA